MNRIRIFLIAAFLAAFSIDASCKDVIIYRKSAINDTRYNDIIEIIQTALEKTKPVYGEFELKATNSTANETRSQVDTREGIIQNITWTGSNPVLEKELLPIYIPLRKGILGFRVFIIKKSDQEKFSKIRTLDDLRKYKVGQEFGWSDVNIFKHNKIPVVTGTDYENLFNMLSIGRFAYFSRGINEAYNEIDSRKDKYPDLCVEKKILLYYPWPYILYISPKYPQIAKRIEEGLKIMIKDGSYDIIFNKYNQSSIDRAKLKDRILIEIDNPFLSPKFDLKDKRLWYNP